MYMKISLSTSYKSVCLCVCYARACVLACACVHSSGNRHNCQAIFPENLNDMHHGTQMSTQTHAFDLFDDRFNAELIAFKTAFPIEQTVFEM